jgi:uncharacterized protein (DUF433 family)
MPEHATYKYLKPKSGSNYRQLFVNGRIRARILYGLYMSAEEPMTPEEIAADYGLPVDAVREAIAYCQTNPPEIAEDFAREERRVQATGMNESNAKHGGKYRILSVEERVRRGL